MIPFILALIALLLIFALRQWCEDRAMRKITDAANAMHDAVQAQQDLADLPLYDTVEEALRSRSYVNPDPRPRLPRIRITRG